MLGAYSAASFGHCHPRLVAALCAQAIKLDTISRAFFSRTLADFLKRLCLLTGMDRALPMNSGAEAVETAIKAARKWGYTVKGIPVDAAEIIVCENNFHGRTITITGFSTVEQYRRGFGPYAPGFKIVPYGDAEALEAAITDRTAAFLVEPIQGEAGVVVPPAGYLRRAAEICRRNNILFISDEVQSGLGRTGYILACEHEGVRPDAVTVGKALGGGLLPVSAFAARREVIDVFTPGDHGSTFGGNPIASAVGLEALSLLVEEELPRRSAELGAYFLRELRGLGLPWVKEVRGRGLFVGVEFDSKYVEARDVASQLAKEGILTKDTHRNTIRFAPPLTIQREELDWALQRIRAACASLAAHAPAPA
jgi:ornithine--oxo-acid transaminase